MTYHNSNICKVKKLKCNAWESNLGYRMVGTHGCIELLLPPKSLSLETDLALTAPNVLFEYYVIYVYVRRSAS